MSTSWIIEHSRAGTRVEKGFTLVEFIMVIVVLGILAAYAIVDNASPSVLTLPSQAETLASDIRHLQSLATAGSATRLALTAGTNGRYVGSRCTVSDCSTTTTVFDVTVEKNVVIAGPATLSFNTRGEPGAAATFTLTAEGATKTVSVAASTGYVTVTP